MLNNWQWTIYFLFRILQIFIKMSMTSVKKKLNEVYPSIEGQLGTQRSLQLNIALQNFKQIYLHNAQSIVIVKSVVELAKSGQMCLKMGMENNANICSATVQQQDKLYFNFNSGEEEIILDKKGKLIEGIQSKSVEKIQKIYEAAIDDLSLNKIVGGIFYLHSNIGSESFRKQKCQIMGTLLALLHANGVYEEYFPQEIIKKVEEFKLLGDDDGNSQFLHEFFMFTHNHLLLLMNGNYMQIPFSQQHKLIFLKTEPQFMEEYSKNLSVHQEKEAKLIQFLDSSFGQHAIHSYQTYEQLLGDYSTKKGDKELIPQLFSTFHKSKLLLQLSNSTIPLSTFFIQYQQAHKAILTQSLNAQLTQISQILPKTPYILLDSGEYVVFLSQKRYSAQSISKLSQYKLKIKKSKVNINENDEEFYMQKKWSNKYKIREEVFSSCASSVYDVLMPSNQIQLDDLI